MEPFSKALAALLRERGLEQMEVAAAADISESAISLYINEQRRPRPETIVKVARALDLNPTYFIEYRRWSLHQALDEWIDTDEAAVEYLLSHLQLAQDQPG